MKSNNKVIASSAAPAAVGTYSQAILAGRTLYVSGQLPIDPATGEFTEGGPRAQFTRIFRNLENILAEAGYGFGDVVKVTVYLADINDFALLNEVYAEFFGEPYPARSAFQVAALPKGARAEIDLIAYRD